MGLLDLWRGSPAPTAAARVEPAVSSIVAPAV
ncbi:hypothetical protein SAMN05519105_0933 [Rhodobacter sp. 24-YEA-8]|nr:hypothetical protein SAMN05519105_0933 [Rhodobacter sp. 24-YEA-8]